MFVNPEYFGSRPLLVAVAAADVRLGHLNQVLGTYSTNHHLARQPQESLCHTTFQDQVGTGVGPQDSGHWTAFTQIGPPGLRSGILVDETAFLALPPPKVVFIVVATFLTSGRDHRFLHSDSAMVSDALIGLFKGLMPNPHVASHSY